jgi:hypothetical protein
MPNPIGRAVVTIEVTSVWTPSNAVWKTVRRSLLNAVVATEVSVASITHTPFLMFYSIYKAKSLEYSI